MCLCRVPGEEVVSGPCLSPVESVFNFVRILRSIRIWTLPSPQHRHTCPPPLFCCNIISGSGISDTVLNECLSSAAVFLPPFRDYPLWFLHKPHNLVCIRAQKRGWCSPILGTCARRLFFLRVRIQNINSQYSNLFLFLAVKLWDSLSRWLWVSVFFPF